MTQQAIHGASGEREDAIYPPHHLQKGHNCAPEALNCVGFFEQMAITDDQRAMLQLLLQRGQSYADISSLLGLDVDGVRSRARSALTEIGGEDPDGDVSLTDYLLGQADPIGRADAARHLQSDAHSRELAERLSTQLRVLAPGAELPEIPGGAGRAKPKEKPKADKPTPAAETTGEDDDSAPESPKASRTSPLSGFASTLSRGQRQLFGGLFAGGILLIFIVLLIAGVFSGGGGGSDQSSSTTTTASNGSSQASNANASGLTRALLTPQNGSKAQGVAVFARVKNTPVLQVNVTGLQPTKSGEAYVIWLYGGPTRAFPLVRQPVKGNGQLRGAAPVPAQLIQALQQGLFNTIDVSLATDKQVTAALQKARKGQSLPAYAGSSVARGAITGPGFQSSSSSGG
jgi:hypothetical protein